MSDTAHRIETKLPAYRMPVHRQSAVRRLSAEMTKLRVQLADEIAIGRLAALPGRRTF